MNEHLISVIIPVYNTAEYLPRCLDSVLNNTYHNLEVICVNDGSRDESLDVLNVYAARDSRVKVIDQKNAGVSAARNRGLDEANGAYIAFVDSDDWVHRQYFEVLLEGLLNHDADIAVCRERITQGPMGDTPVSDEDKVYRFLDTNQIISDSSAKSRVWMRIYRKEIIGNLRFEYGMKLAEDTVFNLNVIGSHDNVKLVLCDGRLYYYFMRADSAIHMMDGNMLKPVAQWYLDHGESRAGQIRDIYIVEALKALYSWRYAARICRRRNELAQIKPMLKKAMLLLRTSNSMAARKKLQYTILSAVPLIYRVFRILNDPTMLTWERNVRKERMKG